MTTFICFLRNSKNIMCHDFYDSFKPTTETFAFVYVHPVINWNLHLYRLSKMFTLNDQKN